MKTASSVRPANGLARFLRMAPILAGLFSGCTCAGNPPPVPTPSATARPLSTPTPLPRVTDTSPPAPTAVEVSSPTAAPVDDAKRAACERYVAVLSGRKTDPDLLNKPEVRALADPDLVMCGAVFSDSDLLCQRLMPDERGPSKDCLHAQSIFHELRTYPKTNSFLLDEVDWRDYCVMPVLTTYCAALRETLRSGNLQPCAAVGGDSICRAYLTADKSLCHVKGKMAGMEVELPKRKPGEPSKVKISNGLEEICRENIESRAFLAKGLDAVAGSGPPRERELAKAALKQESACQTYAQRALQSCMGPAALSTPGPAPASSPAPTSGSAPPPGPPGSAG